MRPCSGKARKSLTPRTPMLRSRSRSLVVTRSGSPTMAFNATSIAANFSSWPRPRMTARGAASPGRGLLKQAAGGGATKRGRPGGRSYVSQKMGVRVDASGQDVTTFRINVVRGVAASGAQAQHALARHQDVRLVYARRRDNEPACDLQATAHRASLVETSLGLTWIRRSSSIGMWHRI